MGMGRIDVRRDVDNLRAVVTGLGDKVIEGYARKDRVGMPEQDELRLEPVISRAFHLHLAKGEIDTGG